MLRIRYAAGNITPLQLKSIEPISIRLKFLLSLTKMIELKGFTISDYVRVSGKVWSFQQELKVYGQKLGGTCIGAVLKKQVSG